jgi:hypothetical protein
MRRMNRIPKAQRPRWADRSLRIRRQLELLPDEGPHSNGLAARVILAAIHRYQRWSMANGRQLCRLGPDRHCSRMAARAAVHLPAMQAIIAIVGILTVPATSKDETCCNLDYICGF